MKISSKNSTTKTLLLSDHCLSIESTDPFLLPTRMYMTHSNNNNLMHDIMNGNVAWGAGTGCISSETNNNCTECNYSNNKNNTYYSIDNNMIPILNIPHKFPSRKRHDTNIKRYR